MHASSTICKVRAGTLSRRVNFGSNSHLLLFSNSDTPSGFCRLRLDLIHGRIRGIMILHGKSAALIAVGPRCVPTVLGAPNVFKLEIPVTIKAFPSASVGVASKLRDKSEFLCIGSRGMDFCGSLRATLTSCTSAVIGLAVLEKNSAVYIPTEIDSTKGLRILLRTSVSRVGVARGRCALTRTVPTKTGVAFADVSGCVGRLNLVFAPGARTCGSMNDFVSVNDVFPSS